MTGRRTAALAALAWAMAAGAAHADMYTWVDKDGITNVSNVAPPEDVRVTKVARSAPKDAAREAAAREAARLAEVRALRDRVDELAKEVERSHDGFPPPYAAAPMIAAAPPPPAPTVVVTVINQPAQPDVSSAGCDGSFGGCGGGFFPGYTYYAPTFPRGFHKPNRKWPTQLPARQNWQLVPPLIPAPATHAVSGRRLG